MTRRRVLPALLTTAVVLLGLTGLPVLAAHADPVPAAYSADTHGDILVLGADVTGRDFAGLHVAHSETTADSESDPRTSTRAANIDAAVTDVPVSPTSLTQTAPPDNAGPDTSGLTQVDIPMLLDTAAVTGTTHARWVGDAACLPSGEPLATSTATMPGATLALPGMPPLVPDVEAAQLGNASTTGTTTLESNGGANDARSVQAVSTGSLASLSLLDDVFTVGIVGAPTLTAVAPGTPGDASVTYDAPTVTVTGPGVNESLTPGDSVTVDEPLVGSVTVTMNDVSETVAADGTSASGSLTMLSLDVNLLNGLGDADLDLLPLSVSATAPTDGVECVLPAPRIAAPTDGASTSDTTPPVSGTAEPGATVHLTLTPAGGSASTVDVTADGSGDWTHTPSSPLAYGDYDAVATQTVDGTTSAQSNNPAFSVVLGAPAIPAPADGSSAIDTTPTISGTAEPGATVHLTVDGGAPVDRAADPTTGAWSYTPPAPLAPGDHTLSATQTAGGTTSAASATSTFGIVAGPTITTPGNGSSTADATPTISGTGEAGAEMSVYLDGTYIGAATVGTGGTWSLPVPVPLPAGDFDVDATQTVGGSNADASPTVFTVVATPVITTLVDRSATNPKPVIGGTGEPGAALQVFIDGASIGTTTVGSGGSWSRPIIAPLAIGHHTADATQSIDGTTADARQRRFRVIPGAPLITAPVEGDSTRDTTPVFTGVALPLARVNVVIDGGSTAHVVADALGQWRFTPAKPLARGDHDVVATQTVNRQTSERSASQAFTVLASAPVGTSPNGGFSSQGAPAADFSATGFSTPLPETGAPAGMVWLGVLGMLVLCGGGLLVAGSRRGRLPGRRA